MCIGARFALVRLFFYLDYVHICRLLKKIISTYWLQIEATTALAKIIREYKIIPSEKYKVRIFLNKSPECIILTCFNKFIGRDESPGQIYFAQSSRGNLRGSCKALAFAVLNQPWNSQIKRQKQFMKCVCATLCSPRSSLLMQILKKSY